MNVLHRDENLAAVELRPQKRTLSFICNVTGNFRRAQYAMPPGVAVVSRHGLSVLFNPIKYQEFDPDRLFATKFRGAANTGEVCLGMIVDKPETLDEAIPFYLDLYYQRPFEGTPPQRLLGYDAITLRSALFYHAYVMKIDARPYREHRYLVNDWNYEERPDPERIYRFPNGEVQVVYGQKDSWFGSPVYSQELDL